MSNFDNPRENQFDETPDDSFDEELNYRTEEFYQDNDDEIFPEESCPGCNGEGYTPDGEICESCDGTGEVTPEDDNWSEVEDFFEENDD